MSSLGAPDLSSNSFHSFTPTEDIQNALSVVLLKLTTNFPAYLVQPVFKVNMLFKQCGNKLCFALYIIKQVMTLTIS